MTSSKKLHGKWALRVLVCWLAFLFLSHFLLEQTLPVPSLFLGERGLVFTLCNWCVPQNPWVIGICFRVGVILQVYLCKVVSLWIPSVGWQHLSLVKLSTEYSLGWMTCNQAAPLVLALFERENCYFHTVFVIHCVPKACPIYFCPVTISGILEIPFVSHLWALQRNGAQCQPNM